MKLTLTISYVNITSNTHLKCSSSAEGNTKMKAFNDGMLSKYVSEAGFLILQKTV